MTAFSELEDIQGAGLILQPAGFPVVVAAQREPAPNQVEEPLLSYQPIGVSVTSMDIIVEAFLDGFDIPTQLSETMTRCVDALVDFHLEKNTLDRAMGKPRIDFVEAR